MTEAKTRRLAILQMLLCGLLWSIGGLFIKKVACHPLAIAGGRAVFASFVIWLFLRCRGVSLTFNRRIALSSIFWSGTFITFVVANKLTTAANTVILHYTSPIFVLLIMRLFFRQPILLLDAFTVTLTLFGISLFFVGDLAFGSLLGNVIALCSGLLIACSFVSLRGSASVERMCGVFFGHLITAIVGLPFFFIGENQLTMSALGYLFILGAVQSAFPSILLSRAAEHCSPLICSLLSAIEPLMNPVWVALFIGERPGPLAIVGGIVVVGAILGNMVAKQKQENAYRKKH